MTPQRDAMPGLVVATWLGMVAVGLAVAVRAAVEPPVWDALSYVQKALSFWRTLEGGGLFNPFNLPMTVRPPGTILMSYPFGWSDDFRWFYFRSCFIPIVLLVGAVYIAGWSRQMNRRERWLLAALALTLAGMPILYQFQPNDVLPSALGWGFVDGFMAGICALAAAAVIRSIAGRSTGWAVIAAATAGLSLWIKPSGLVVIALVGAAWMLFAGFSFRGGVAAWRRDPPLWRFLTCSLAGAILIFGVFIAFAVLSEYFSAANVTYGRGVIAILDKEFVFPLTAANLTMLMRTSVGFVVPAVTAFGLFWALCHRTAFGSASAVILCLAVGIWFWVFETESSQIRYFLPFGVMAFILVVPQILAGLQRFGRGLAVAGAVAMITPTLSTTVLLLTPQPPDAWQRALGVNLHVNDYQAENEQAAGLQRLLKSEGAKGAVVYLSNNTSVLRNLEAVWDYGSMTDPTQPNIRTVLPIDWRRASTLRVEDILRSDFIATEVRPDDAARNATFSRREVADFPALVRLFDVWTSTLGENEGVTLVSETRVRLLRINDRKRLETAFAKLEESHDMPAEYREANQQRWWSPAELGARNAAVASPLADVAFRAASDPSPLHWIRAANVTRDGDSLRASIWLESGAPNTLGGQWFIFAHLVDEAGKILANELIELQPGAGPSPDKTIRYYELSYQNRPKDAVAVAFGLFQPAGGDTTFLYADQGARDWEGRRLILPLPAY